jgi:hypothetical protein
VPYLDNHLIRLSLVSLLLTQPKDDDDFQIRDSQVGAGKEKVWQITNAIHKRKRERKKKIACVELHTSEEGRGWKTGRRARKGLKKNKKKKRTEKRAAAAEEGEGEEEKSQETQTHWLRCSVALSISLPTYCVYVPT